MLGSILRSIPSIVQLARDVRDTYRESKRRRQAAKARTASDLDRLRTEAGTKASWER